MTTEAAPHGGVDRRKGTRDALDRFVRQRTTMWSLYWRLAGLKPFSEENDTLASTLDEFCQVLVDYVAGGHFTIYDRIEQGRERRKSVAELADSLYPKIVDLTDVAIRFNDRYMEGAPDKPTLDRDLSYLGEALANRIELEDQLINELVGMPQPA